MKQLSILLLISCFVVQQNIIETQSETTELQALLQENLEQQKLQLTRIDDLQQMERQANGQRQRLQTQLQLRQEELQELHEIQAQLQEEIQAQLQGHLQAQLHAQVLEQLIAQLVEGPPEGELIVIPQLVEGPPEGPEGPEAQAQAQALVAQALVALAQAQAQAQALAQAQAQAQLVRAQLLEQELRLQQEERRIISQLSSQDNLIDKIQDLQHRHKHNLNSLHAQEHHLNSLQANLQQGEELQLQLQLKPGIQLRLQLQEEQNKCDCDSCKKK